MISHSKQNKKYLNKILKYTICPLIIFVLFKNKIDDLLSFFIVKPFLSYVHHTLLIDLIVISSCVFVSILFYKKIINDVKIPLSWYLLTVAFSIIYLTYRINSNVFIFTSFSFSKKIKLLDILVLVPINICVFSFLYPKSKPLEMDCPELGFSIDEPINITINNDKLKRVKFIEKLTLMISYTNSHYGSFPIGIVSPWGSGKTSFLNSLKTEASKYDILCIEFNVWKNNSSDQIIQSFFSLLKENLKDYSFSINNKINEYANSLVKETKNEFLKSFFQAFLSIESIDEQYKSINSEIKRINKKILVLIDDIDRLNKTEIYEVIRLIRNTANFSNMFFIVAYDRNYILNAIEEINSYQSHIFLEKIFQVEFNLPPIEKTVVQEEIKKKMRSILTDKSMNCFNEFVGNNKNIYQENNVDFTKDFILNMRDVIRFVNSFHLNYLYLKDEIYFPDFYNLELIRFKHPHIFIDFFRNIETFLFLGTRKDYYPQKPFTYALKKISNQKEEGKKLNYKLMEHLKEHQGIYKINLSEINLIVSSFAKIFPQHDQSDISKWGLNAHLSVVVPSMLDRYFRLGIDGKLSEIQFSIARELESTEFNKRILEWCQIDSLAEQLCERFTQINDFDSKADFKKVVSGIFYFANLPNEGKSKEYQSYIGYDNSSLASLLGKEFVIKNLYNNDKNEYKIFLNSILNIKQVNYNYTHDFVSHLLHTGYYSISQILCADEISDLLFLNFQFAIINANTILDVWPHYNQCEIRKETETGHNAYKISYPINEKAFPLLRRFIYEKDLDGFIKLCVRKIPFEDKYTLGSTAKDIFKSIDIFIWLLKRYKGESVYKDRFVKFCEAQNDAESKNGLSFDFGE